MMASQVSTQPDFCQLINFIDRWLVKDLFFAYFSFTVDHVSQLTSGTSVMKSFSDPTKSLSVYGLTRSTHRGHLRSACHKFRWPMAIFCVHLLFTWHDLCDWFKSNGSSIPFPYISACIAFLRQVCMGFGCYCMSLQWHWYNEPSLLHV